MADSIKELDSVPGVLGNYAKAFGGVLPLAGRLPFLPGGGGDLPDLALELDALAVDPDHLAAYAKVCEFTLRDQLPATYPNVLAFPVHIALMTDGRFPFGPVGLVHLRNEITQHRPIGLGEKLDLKVWTTGLDPHPKGRTLTLHTDVRVGGEIVWDARSTMLRRGKGSGDDGSANAVEAPVPDASATWRLDSGLGRRYAAVSGDRNPIHMHALTAKAFGFPRAIAHGLWTKARCVAALDGRLPDAFTIDVRFRRPVLLPTVVTFGSATDGDTTYFTVRDHKTGAAHLDGTIDERTAQ